MKLARMFRMINFYQDQLCQYRIGKSPVRRFITIDTTGLTQKEIEFYMNEFKLQNPEPLPLVQQIDYDSIQQKLDLLEKQFQEAIFTRLTSIGRAEEVLNIIDSLFDKEPFTDFIKASLNNLKKGELNARQ